MLCVPPCASFWFPYNKQTPESDPGVKEKCPLYKLSKQDTHTGPSQNYKLQNLIFFTS